MNVRNGSNTTGNRRITIKRRVIGPELGRGNNFITRGEQNTTAKRKRPDPGMNVNIPIRKRVMKSHKRGNGLTTGCRNLDPRQGEDH